MNASPNLWTVIKRTLARRCPACGKGRLFHSYLKQVQQCECCGEAYGHIRADDGPAWLTIIIVGHILAPILLIVIPNSTWPEWLSVLIWPGFALILAALILPRAKGLFIGLIWRMQCHGAY